MSALDEVVALQRFSAARVTVLGTVAGSGQPHLVPVTAAVAEATVVFAVDSKPKTTVRLRRLRNIAENPRVSFLADEYDDDWARLWWVRVDAVAEILRAGPRHEAALDVLAAKYHQYRTSRPAGVVVSARITGIVGWAARP